VAALEDLGLTVEIGPFGSSFLVSPERLAEAMGIIVTVAHAHGATRVALNTEVQ
jgi:hypothetical protein